MYKKYNVKKINFIKIFYDKNSLRRILYFILYYLILYFQIYISNNFLNEKEKKEIEFFCINI